VATGNMRRKVEVWTSGFCDTHAGRKRTQTDLQTDTLIAILRSPTLPYRNSPGALVKILVKIGKNVIKLIFSE